MQQTILAFLGIMILMALAFSQHQRKIVSQGTMVDQEIEIMANGMAMHVIEFSGARSFDERTIPPQMVASGAPVDHTEFAPRNAWTAWDDATYPCHLVKPFMSDPACNDISDLNMPPNMWKPVNYSGRNGATVELEAHVEVFYVNDSNPDNELPDTQTSNYKKVVVTLRSMDQVRNGRYTNGLLTIERVFAYNEEREMRRAGL